MSEFPTQLSEQAVLNGAYDATTNSLRSQGTAASGAADVGNPVKVGGKYNATAPTLTDGQRGDAQLDVSGNLKAAEQYIPAAEDNANGVIATINKPLIQTAYDTSLYSKFGTETKGAVKTSNAQLFSIRLDSLETTTLYYLQLKGKNAVFADADVPDISIPIPLAATGSSVSITLGSEFFRQAGKNFATGITWGVSSTKATFTTAGPTAASYNVHINYL